METYEHREPWNKGKLVGQKAPLKPKDIWAIRIHLQNIHEARGLAMFNLAIDSKLRGCDLVNLRVRDVTHGSQILTRAMVVQRKTQRPVQFELTEPTRTSVAAWIAKASLQSEDFLFPSRLHTSPHVSTRQYARIRTLGVGGRVGHIGLRHALDAADEGDADLQADEELEGRPVAARSLQAGKYSQIPWHRSRRCLGDLRADRDLTHRRSRFASNTSAPSGRLPTEYRNGTVCHEEALGP